VCYDTQVETIFTNCTMENKESLIEQVRTLGVKGSTNLMGGLERGTELLVNNYKPANNTRIFTLFSDGLVNVGMQDSKLIMRKVSDDIVEKSNICVSAFGLGNDFDETLMKGIAEYGKGAYFFIEGPQSIPTFVEFALKYILNAIGTEAVLRVSGANGCEVKKFYGNYNLVTGAWLGDLRENNERSVIAKFAARGDVNEEAINVINYELVFKERNGNEKVIMKELNLNYTDNRENVIDNPDVCVKVAIQKSASIDKKIAVLLDQNDKSDKVLELQQSQINLYERVLDMDREMLDGKNKIDALLTKARETLENLRDKNKREKKPRKK